MRKTQFSDEEMMDFDTDILENPNSTQNQININTGLTVTDGMEITSDNQFINFHSKANNSYKVVSSYDINQMTKNEKNAVLKIKINNNVPNEMVLINSNFQLHYMTIKEDSLFHLCTFNMEHTDRINDVCFYKDGVAPFDKAFISASSDGTIKIWDSRTAESVKTISTSQKKKVFTVDTNKDILAAGLEREIILWDLKTMKQLGRIKFAHSEDVTFVKLRGNILLSGGEDNIVNVFDLQNGCGMDSVISTTHVGQPVASLGFLDDEVNYIQIVTIVQSYHIFNMFTGVSVFDFDAKSETYKTDYILDSYYNKDTNNIDLFCGNFYGDISLFNLPLTPNPKDITLNFDSLIKTNMIQTFNSVDRIPTHPSCYLTVSDEGLLYIIDKKSEIEKAHEELNHLQLLDEENDKEKNQMDLVGGNHQQIGNERNINLKMNSGNNKMNSSTKKKAIANKFSPY